MKSTPRIYTSRLLAVWMGFALALLGGCSSAEIDENDPAALMKEAEDDIESSRYILALEKLQKVKNQHPYSNHATEAQLRIGDVYYLQENFAEAAATYEAFKDLHPKHPKLGYAAFRVGLSFFGDVPANHARDLTSAYRAEEAFKEYLYQFPSGEFAGEAKEKLAESRRALAEKEMYVARFYFKRKMWEAAKGRFAKVVSQYPESKFAGEAQKRLQEIESKPPEKTDEKRN